MGILLERFDRPCATQALLNHRIYLMGRQGEQRNLRRREESRPYQEKQNQADTDRGDCRLAQFGADDWHGVLEEAAPGQYCEERYPHATT